MNRIEFNKFKVKPCTGLQRTRGNISVVFFLRMRDIMLCAKENKIWLSVCLLTIYNFFVDAPPSCSPPQSQALYEVIIVREEEEDAVEGGGKKMVWYGCWKGFKRKKKKGKFRKIFLGFSFSIPDG